MNKIEEYFKSKKVSNSLLGAYLNPKYIWLRQQGLVEDEDKIFFRIGGAVDCLLTNPSEWENLYFISTAVKPTGLLGKFVDALPQGITQFSAVEEYEPAYKIAGYKANLNLVIKWFWEAKEAVQYYEDRFSNVDNKILLSADEFAIVENCVRLIRENPFTRDIFAEAKEGEEKLFQEPIYFTLEGEECKALPDVVVIDHNARTIQPYDLKTTGKSVHQFPISFVQFGYYRQAAFYTLALSEYIKERSLWDKRDLNNYTMLPFKFVVVETKLNTFNPAIIYTTTPNDIEVGLYGGKLKENSCPVKGIYHLLECYKWHKENDEWILPMEIYKSNGEVTLDAFTSNYFF